MGNHLDGSPRRVAAHTLGCKVNQYDTDSVLKTFADRGYRVVGFEEPAEVYLINTCTVTNAGDKKSRQIIRRAVRTNPGAVVVAMGCYAQVAPSELAAIPGLDLVIGNQGRTEVVDLVEAELLRRRSGATADPRVVVDRLNSGLRFEELGGGLAEYVRATVKIQEGCTQFCAYCKVPYARGPERSRDPKHILDEVKGLSAQGIMEIVLTGIHLGSYGRDLGGIDLAEIAERVADVDGVHRVRLSSIEPNDVTPKLISVVAGHQVLCRHFHVPLQSGSDAVLARMRRRYDREAYGEVIESIRDSIPGAAVTTDVIVGFPGESDEEYEDTVAFVRKVGFSRLHVFPYSRRKGTPAASFPGQVPEPVKADRVSSLIRVGEDLSLAFHQRLLGKEVEILCEAADAGDWVGLTDTYVKVRTSSQRDIFGQMGMVRIEEADPVEIRGSWLDDMSGGKADVSEK